MQSKFLIAGFANNFWSYLQMRPIFRLSRFALKKWKCTAVNQFFFFFVIKHKRLILKYSSVCFQAHQKLIIVDLKFSEQFQINWDRVIFKKIFSTDVDHNLFGSRPWPADVWAKHRSLNIKAHRWDRPTHFNFKYGASSNSFKFE